MRVCSERAQKAEITGTRRAESPRRSRCTTSQGARPEDARQIGLIRARSRSLMVEWGNGAERASNDADVSIAPSKIPYGGFSPVRLQGQHVE